MDSYHAMIHQNLVLLTKIFSNLDMESKIQKGMFKRPNTKGMQSVFYSLIYILNAEYCQKWLPWPISFASDNYKFRTAVIDFIRKECPDFQEPKLLPSLLNKAEGDKFVKFIFNFVTYVTKTIISKKFDDLVLEKPNSNYEENSNILDEIASSSVEEDQRYLEDYKIFIDKSNIIANVIVQETESKLKDYQRKRQMLHAYFQDALSYTNVTEESVMDCIVKGYEEDMIDLKNQSDSLKIELYSKFKRRERLMYLLNLKQKLSTKSFEVNALKSRLNENFAEIVKTPLPIIQSSLFVHSHFDTEICLKTFLHYGHFVIREHINRFLKLNPRNQHLPVCETVNDISLNTIKRLQCFSQLETELNALINDAKDSIPKLEDQYLAKYSNSLIVDAFVTIRSYEIYYPHLETCVSGSALFHFSEKGNSDPIDKVKRRMKLVKTKA